ncbi:MAG: helix-hairpin-helix domain-containing protein, partial [Bacteroidales bacterium]|nr:helix-hairpin-helix domain-containing protein [Bacteroidales bacterium]
MSNLFFKEYFHFTKGEKIGTIVLLILIVVVLLLTFLLPGFIKNEKVDFGDFEKEIEAFKKSNAGDTTNNLSGSLTSTENKEPELFSFNPNEITKEDLRRLGLDARVVNTWLKYREKGGSFRKKEDVKKIYGLTDSVYTILASYILLPDNIRQKKPFDKKSVDIKEDQIAIHTNPSLIELNGSDTIELKRLPGIGSVFAARIVGYRELLGGYYKKEQLMEVYGLSPQTYNNVLTLINIDTNLIRKLDLNSSDFRDLLRHPYLNKYQTEAILQYR